jgi:vacuolar protein sorting-associated protein 35
LSLKYSAASESDDKWDKKCQKIFQFVHQTITAIMKDSNCPELCLRLFLQAGLNAARTGVENKETIAYEFVSQSLAIYEEEISDSKQQLASLLLVISTVKEIGFKIDENVQPLRSQCCLNGAKLVKKSDQCRAILNASLLFCDKESNSIETDGIKCIKKCIKISSTVLDMELQLQLYVEILSHLTLLVNFKNKDVEDIVGQLIEKIDEQRQETTLSELIERQYFNNLSLLRNDGQTVGDTPAPAEVKAEPVAIAVE